MFLFLLCVDDLQLSGLRTTEHRTQYRTLHLVNLMLTYRTLHIIEQGGGSLYSMPDHMRLYCTWRAEHQSFVVSFICVITLGI